ncbi:MAG: nucleotidyltransferase domain-containing protein [Nitrospinae bacterium]|nr:nucleotidyltransferase domain-containing protein [Nitrospinota bacterium]
MAKRKIREAINYLSNLLKDNGIDVDRIILFGSHAKGNYRADSDIDLVVISKDFTRKDIFERADMLGDIEWRLIKKYLFPFDIITMSPEEFEKGISLVSHFAKNGKIVYAKQT